MYNVCFTIPNLFVYFLLYIIIYIFVSMDIKEFLLTQDDLNLTKFAKRMWPTNKNAKSYLSKKLHNLDDRTFTEKDAALAHKALNDLKSELGKISTPKK